jgi:hypothetical protein
MPRPWTKLDDRTLRVLYQNIDVSMQKIRDTLHRGTHDIHARAAFLSLVRPSREHQTKKSSTNGAPRTKAVVTRPIHRNAPHWAVDVLRRQGYSPVFAQRRSDLSMEETGYWIVGTRLLSRAELEALALKYRRG